MSKSFLSRIEQTITQRPGEISIEPGYQSNPYQDTKRMNNARLIRLENILPDPNQPRKDFKDDALNELADSIQRHGLLQPIAVEIGEEGKFKLIAGERRYRACGIAGLEEIPCMVITTGGSKDKFAKQLVENFVREDLNPIEKAYALIEYKDILGTESRWEDVERSLGISDTRRKQFIRLLNLPEEMQNQIVLRSRIDNTQQITEGHARALLLLNNHPEEQRSLFEQLTADDNKISSAEAMDIARQMRDKHLKKTEQKNRITFVYQTVADLLEQLRLKISELEGNNVPRQEN